MARTRGSPLLGTTIVGGVILSCNQSSSADYNGGTANQAEYGGEMTDSQAQEIMDIAIDRGALTFGEFKLSAGGTSSYYFDGRILSLDPEGGYAVAKAFLPIIMESGAQAVAGPTLGADPIVSAISVVSHLEGHPTPGLIVRKDSKDYGGKRSIEGAYGRTWRRRACCGGRRHLHHRLQPVSRHRRRRGRRVQSRQGADDPRPQRGRQR